MSFNVGDLVTSKEYLLGFIYKVAEIGPKNSESYGREFYLNDLALATPEEIAKVVAERLKGKSVNNIETLSGLFKEVYGDKLESLIPQTSIFGKKE